MTHRGPRAPALHWYPSHPKNPRIPTGVSTTYHLSLLLLRNHQEHQGHVAIQEVTAVRRMMLHMEMRGCRTLPRDGNSHGDMISMCSLPAVAAHLLVITISSISITHQVVAIVVIETLEIGIVDQTEVIIGMIEITDQIEIIVLIETVGVTETEDNVVVAMGGMVIPRMNTTHPHEEEATGVRPWRMMA